MQAGMASFQLSQGSLVPGERKGQGHLPPSFSHSFSSFSFIFSSLLPPLFLLLLFFSSAPFSSSHLYSPLLLLSSSSRPQVLSSFCDWTQSSGKETWPSWAAEGRPVPQHGCAPASKRWKSKFIQARVIQSLHASKKRQKNLPCPSDELFLYFEI